MCRTSGRNVCGNLRGTDRALDAMTPLAVLLALLIGASLGLVGGGGSILTVPALVHAGGFMPFQLGRFDHAFAVRAEAKAKTAQPPSSYLDRFWFDTITHSDAALRFLTDLVGTDRVVLGTDLPFDMADAVPLERLRRVRVDPHALGATAAALLRL